MPRGARRKSQSGIYHVMLRGINKQVIFEDEEDNIKFLKVLKECKEKSGFTLLAYCIMGNHLHLLLKEEKEELEQIFRRLGASYVYWYNLKYDRSGHLFQDRFKSEPVESDSYFFTVLRYIHQNPIKSGLCDKAERYKWSSYNEYINNNGITDTEFGLSMFSNERKEAIKLFAKYMNENDNEECLEMEQTSRRISDKEAQEKMCKLCRTKNAAEFQKVDVETRNKNIAILKENGLSIRQISRLTGISFGIIRKI
jgi:putative transposase